MTSNTSPPEEISAEQREELIRRSWMTNDGLWFYHTAQARGIDGANETNSVVVREFGRQEMRRLMRAFSVAKVETAEQYRKLFEAAVDLYLGSLIESENAFDDDTHDIKVTTCFAYKGVKRAGIDKIYHCGPGERLNGWLDAMEISAEVQPSVGLCQMAHSGSCGYRVKIGAWSKSE